MINYNGWQKELINKKNIGYVLPVDINDNMVKEFALYSQKKVLIAKQQENALNIAEESYATDVAVVKYNVIFKDIFKNVKK
mgnify:CR=1 FL=1